VNSWQKNIREFVAKKSMRGKKSIRGQNPTLNF